MTEQAEDKSAGSSLPPVRGGRQVCMLMLLAAVILASGIAIGAGGAMFWLGKRPPRPPAAWHRVQPAAFISAMSAFFVPAQPRVAQPFGA